MSPARVCNRKAKESQYTLCVCVWKALERQNMLRVCAYACLQLVSHSTAQPLYSVWYIDIHVRTLEQSTSAGDNNEKQK